MKPVTALSLTILLAATVTLAADQKNLVFQDSKPADQRLSESHDLDHPWLFDPSAFTTVPFLIKVPIATSPFSPSYVFKERTRQCLCPDATA